MNAQRRAGFTLIELLVVISVIALLASILTVSVVGALRKSRANTVRSNMLVIERAADAYQNDHRIFPSDGGGVSSPEESSALLFDALGHGQGRSATYLADDIPSTLINGRRVLADAWRQPIAYRNPRSYARQSPKSTGIRLYSAGPDGDFETENDNIVNWDIDSYPDARRQP